METRVSSIRYFNPIDQDFRAVDVFRNKVVGFESKATVVVLTILGSVFGFGGGAAFRWATEKLSGGSILRKVAQKVQNASKPLINAKEISTQGFDAKEVENCSSKSVVSLLNPSEETIEVLPPLFEESVESLGEVSNAAELFQEIPQIPTQNIDDVMHRAITLSLDPQHTPEHGFYLLRDIIQTVYSSEFMKDRASYIKNWKPKYKYEESAKTFLTEHLSSEKIEITPLIGGADISSLMLGACENALDLIQDQTSEKHLYDGARVFLSEVIRNIHTQAFKNSPRKYVGDWNVQEKYKGSARDYITEELAVYQRNFLSNEIHTAAERAFNNREDFQKDSILKEILFHSHHDDFIVDPDMYLKELQRKRNLGKHSQEAVKFLSDFLSTSWKERK